ncbi:peptidylprolyl isomerase [Petrotoga sp. 9PWA.NaAc.5.4]|uniref:peptidylprolyl isomerase n=1 Tax=Petrotoga sp. 9PWA.NaAc.5.4 TaxID=1434328 RepID=UPI000CB9B4DA|nr:peptidylprolyl isomerase [Petrotoga sp. 9PWA.NaAc.5.4]PNR94672.1 hypothetical protein X924_06190 [Petrotoga sp. 9PWA.NaAc.5.4]
MNNWFKKHEKVITILVVAGFLAGIVWWSVATYLTSRNPVSDVRSNSLRKEDSVLVITKANVELNYPYWIMQNEVENITQQQAQIYQQYYGQKLDPVFDYLILKNLVTDLLYDEKVVRYYAESKNLLPDSKMIEEELNKQVNLYIQQYKSDPISWNSMVQYYGSEQNIRNILVTSLQATIENDLINRKVKESVASVSRQEGLNYIQENFDSIKNNYEQVRIQHILIFDEATASNLKEEILSNQISFEEAASLYSEDTVNATNSGEIGWIKRGEYESTFEEAVFNANVGEIVGPVETFEGYHLIRVLDKKVFSNPEDVFLYDDVYAEIESILEEQKFSSWLVEYKQQEDFGRNYYDLKLMYIHELSIVGEDREKLEELAKELENIVFDGDGISLEAESDYLAIYTLVVTQLLGTYDEQLRVLSSYIISEQNLDANLSSLTLEEVNQKIDELTTILQEETSINNIEEELTKYENFREYLNNLTSAQKLGVNSTEEASTLRTDLQDKVNEYTNKLTKVLADLFAQYPSSNTVVQLYYQINPQDPKVIVSYSKLQLNQLKQYYMYFGPQILFAYFQQPINEILINVQIVVDSAQADTDTKLEALEIGLDLSELLGLNEIKLYYLETIKELAPNYYSNIDQLIEETQKIIDEQISNAVTSTSQSTDLTAE